MSTVADRIKLVRKDQGLSQAEFAQRLRITRGHISKLEIGQATPSDQLLALIELNFNLNYDWLETGEGDMYLAPHLNMAERDATVAVYALLRDRIQLFFMNYDWLETSLEEALKQALRLDPELCPPDLLPLFEKIAEIPNGELFRLAKAHLTAQGYYPEESKEE
jgi:transcriptional regulator with XRE-family HTH domain